jgi:hypothetical protein
MTNGTNPPKAPSAPGTKSITCLVCGAPITLRALGSSVMVACPSCRSQLDISTPEIQIIKRYRATAEQFRLPLGSRGSLRGKTFEVVGAMVRSIDGFRWTEYLLFNPFGGFRWLIEDEGHWSLGETVKDPSEVKPGGAGIRYHDREFRKFAVGEAVVDLVVGEFYWRVKVDDRAATRDWVAPPLMLSQEKTATESSWTLLEYLEPREVERAFKVTLGEREDIAPHQPCPATVTLRSIQPFLWGSLGMALLLQIVTLFAARSQSMVVGDYLPASSRGQESAFGPVHLAASHSLNEITAYAPLNDSWVELEYAFVNKATGVSYEMGQQFEFYSGVDSDGAWTEGSTSASTLLPGVPAGDYDIVVDASSGGSKGTPLQQPIRLTLTHDVVPWRNFWIACAVIACYPLVLLYRRLVFERRRWGASAFNTHATVTG